MLKPYASYFTAYMLSNLKETANIERVVLYGSAARDEATKESDVDIFIEVKKTTAKFKKQIEQIEKGFYQSREAALFKAKDISNKFSIKTGKLEEWQDLYQSIASTGIILFGPYEARELPSGIKHFVIIFWEKIHKNRGSFLNKLYGFRIKGKHYKGLLSKFEGKKLGKSCIMLPIQYKKEVFKLLEGHKVEAKILEVFS
ncbi:MAG: nucleotidyltransferase domain-containing protein [Candidatus Woesearchaeota archaeon]